MVKLSSSVLKNFRADMSHPPTTALFLPRARYLNGQVTKLGRVFDPFVDKIIICGAFIFLAAEPASGVAAWMAVVVVGREMLVTALRGFIEQSGGDFSAQLAGKLKMVLQCVAVVASLVTLSYGERPQPDWLPITLQISVWAAVSPLAIWIARSSVSF